MAQNSGIFVLDPLPTVSVHSESGLNESEVQTTSTSEHSSSEPNMVKKRGPWKLLCVLTGLNLSIFLSALDQTIVATAVPTIVSDFHTSSGYVWIGGAYLLANAASGPIWTKLSDIWGRKPMILSAVALFLISSIVCATATSMRILILGRALQGTAGGGLSQLTIICISDMFSMRSRSLYAGLTELMWAIAASIGPVIGGVLTEKATWRYCFWINLPVSGATFILLIIFLDVHNPRTALSDGLKAIDWFGTLSMLGVTTMILLGLEFGGTLFEWKSPTIICLIVFGVAMIGVFVFGEFKVAKYPIMPMGLFNDRSTIACIVVGFLNGMIYISHEYYLPLYFQSVFEASPKRSGLLITPLVVAEALFALLAGILIHRTGGYMALLYVGGALMALGNGLYCHFGPTTPVYQIVLFQIIAGMGSGLTFQPPLTALQAHVTQEDTATAIASYGFLRNMGTSLSLVVCGVIFQNMMNHQVKQLVSGTLPIPSNITDALTGGSAAANVLIIGTIHDQAQKDAVKGAFANSLRCAWYFTTVLAGLTFIAVFFVRRLHLSKEHTETITGLKNEKRRANATRNQ